MKAKKQNNIEALRQHITEAEMLLKLMASSARLAILFHLVEGEQKVGALVDLVQLSQPAVSQHLARMRYEGLVTAEKRGQSVHYRIARPEVLKLMEAIENIFLKTEKPKAKPAKVKSAAASAAAKPAKKKAAKKAPAPVQMSLLG